MNEEIKTRYVYKLIDPRYDLVFYIGQTDNPSKRLSDHIALKTLSNAEYISEMLGRGVIPEMEIMVEAVCSKSRILEIERGFIEYCLHTSFPNVALVNRDALSEKYIIPIIHPAQLTEILKTVVEERKLREAMQSHE